jgi:hypothetical protein
MYITFDEPLLDFLVPNPFSASRRISTVLGDKRLRRRFLRPRGAPKLRRDHSLDIATSKGVGAYQPRLGVVLSLCFQSDPGLIPVRELDPGTLEGGADGVDGTLAQLLAALKARNRVRRDFRQFGQVPDPQTERRSRHFRLDGVQFRSTVMIFIDSPCLIPLS